MKRPTHLSGTLGFKPMCVVLLNCIVEMVAFFTVTVEHSQGNAARDVMVGNLLKVVGIFKGLLRYGTKGEIGLAFVIIQLVIFVDREKLLSANSSRKIVGSYVILTVMLGCLARPSPPPPPPQKNSHQNHLMLTFLTT